MEFDEKQEKYLKQYIQRQEILLLDYIRKTIDLEIKSINLNASLIEFKTKYEESQKQVEIQNDLMQQAANGVESLTIEKKSFEEKEKRLNDTILELKNSLNDCKQERQKIIQEYESFKLNNLNNDKKFQDLSEEYHRQIEEMNKLYQENQELKSKLPINKSKAKTAKLPTDEF